MKHEILRLMDIGRWVASEVRRLREHAGYKQSGFAKAMGYKTPSGWQRYESVDDYSGGYLDREIVARMETLLAGKGKPRITSDEVWALAGPEFSRVKRLSASSFDPDAPESEHDPDWDGSGAAVVDGSLTFERSIEGSQPEVAAAPGLGNGKFDDRPARVVSNGIATGHPVTNEWVIPANYVRNALDAQPTQVVIMPVIGHSMEPLLRSNDRVLVDVSQNIWLGDAVYVIDDGDGVFQAKTVKKVMSSHPPRYRIVSEASPDEEPVVRKYDEFRIVGRVVGRFTRM
jgi:hypothetical protein